MGLARLAADPSAGALSWFPVQWPAHLRHQAAAIPAARLLSAGAGAAVAPLAAGRAADAYLAGGGQGQVEVRLQRRNWQAATASLHFSRCTGAYDLGLETTHHGLPFERLLDPQALEQTCMEMARHRAWLEEGCRALPPQLELSYEELINQQPEQLGRLVAGLEQGLDRSEPGIQEALRRPIRREQFPWDDERREWLRQLEAAVISLGY